MSESPTIRLASGSEYDALGLLIYDAIHTDNAAYSEAEKTAWMPAPPEGLAWAARLAVQEVWVAEAEGELVGLITLAPEGYIDFAYIVAPYRGSGLFQRLYATLETEARAQNLERLWSHASLMATPALEKRGFRIVRPDPVERDGETLMRFEVEKFLKPAEQTDA